MTANVPGPESTPETLTDARKLLINRYIAEGLGLVEHEPEAPPHEDAPPVSAPPAAPAEPLVTALDPVANGNGSHRRRGRPRGARKRRQVHFHVDPDEDQLLLRAAGHFGSQQRALIAALHSLNELLALRKQVEDLQAECNRQRRLLAEAQALFEST